MIINHIKKHGFKVTWCKLFHSYKCSEFAFKSIRVSPCDFFDGVNDYVATYEVKCSCGCSYEQSFLILGKSEYFPEGCPDIYGAQIKARNSTRMELVGK